MQQLRLLAAALVLQRAGQDQRQRLGVIEAVQSGELVADHVRGPILRDAAGNQAVQRLRGTPHHVRPNRVVPRLGQRLRAFFDERQQNRLGLTILQRGIGRVRQVLLGRVNERIDHAVGRLTRRQRVGRFGIENRETREVRRRNEKQLLFRRFTGDYRSTVGLRTRRGQGQHAADRQRIGGNQFPVGQHVPRVFALVRHGGGDELCAVQHRTAADGQQKIDAFSPNELDRLHAGFVARIRLDAAELDHLSAVQGAGHLVVYAVAL